MENVIELHPEIRRLVGDDTGAERIADGFTFTEGPVWDYRRGRLLFSDIPGDTVYEWTAGKGHVPFRRSSANTNGNTIDQDGRVVCCEHAGRRVSRESSDGTFETVAGDYQGGRLNSPNDVICDSNGDIIFTDPPYGLRRSDGTFARGELGFDGVFRVNGRGEIALLADDFTRPNGLLLNAVETQLFVDDTEHQHVRVFDISQDGTLANGRIFAKLEYEDLEPRPDGMKMDVEGNIYIAGNTPEGLWVFDPEGTLLGLISVGEPPSNLAWGGEDWSTLFVTARTSVYRLSMRVAGLQVGGPR